MAEGQIEIGDPEVRDPLSADSYLDQSEGAQLVQEDDSGDLYMVTIYYAAEINSTNEVGLIKTRITNDTDGDLYLHRVTGGGKTDTLGKILIHLKQSPYRSADTLYRVENTGGLPETDSNGDMDVKFPQETLGGWTWEENETLLVDQLFESYVDQSNMTGEQGYNYIQILATTNPGRAVV